MEVVSKKCFLLLVMLYITADAIEVEIDDCTLQLPRLSFFAPLVFTPNGTLKPTESNGDNNFVKIENAEKIVLSCAPNYFKSIESKFVEATCRGNNLLAVNDVNKNFLKDLSCEMRSIEEILTPVTGCDSKYTSVEFGYTNPVTEQSHVLGEACYDEELGRTIFVHIKSKSDFISAEIMDASLKIGDANYFKNKHPLSRYKLDFLMASRIDGLNSRMTESLGAENVPESLSQNHFVGMNVLLNRQFYNTLKLGWNYVMFNGIDPVTNLELLESDILQIKSEKSIDLYIGTNGVLKVLGKNGDTELYLNKNRFPVPKYVWIGVKSDRNFVGFAVVNSPTVEADLFFNSKCDQITWLKQVVERNLADNRKIVCCEYQNFKNNIPEMPELTGKFELFV
ncbi:uncharacterized protein LOC119071244 isoform X1 [Bradysia coprophila]|uniref:uncharacterized protein LOC119071244 isoform X1 n=1 Tax=Bradysia coprophila TaxID=38358 RepID=UPI00187D8166|nr:uncharacterized protein LOC119071244 isoform X1 [Bradysia coprophila]